MKEKCPACLAKHLAFSAAPHILPLLRCRVVIAEFSGDLIICCCTPCEILFYSVVRGGLINHLLQGWHQLIGPFGLSEGYLTYSKNSSIVSGRTLRDDLKPPLPLLPRVMSVACILFLPVRWRTQTKMNKKHPASKPITIIYLFPGIYRNHFCCL